MTSSAVEVINIGAYPNDATGDPIREAFTKINYNFTLFSGTLNPFTPTVPGLVPASGGGTSTTLRADGTWTSIFTGSWTFPTLNSTTVNANLVNASLVNTTTVDATNVNTTNLSLAALTAVTIVASSQVTIAGEAAYDPITGNIGYYALTSFEATSGVTPSSHAYPFLDSRRYAFDLTGNPANGVTNATLLTNVFKAAGLAAASTGQTQTVSLYPGIYCITRGYINYSNVYLQGYGATIVQTKTGITNSQVTGTTPAYAIIHINPLTYTINPGSPVTAINNVRIFGDLTVQGPYVQAVFTGVISATTLTVSGFIAGGTPIVVGTQIVGANVTQSTFVTGLGTGTGGNGTYTVNNSQTVLSEAMTANTAYDQYALGIVSNDCNKCWIQDITIQGCGAENALHGPSAWNTCSDLRIVGNEIFQGGEIGVNNGRAFQIKNNYVHDSWFQNGVGGDGDNGQITGNLIRNMAGAGMALGGSGARDIGVSRDITTMGNTITVTGISLAGTFQVFMSDDGATSVPKLNHKFIANTLDTHYGNISLGCDYNTGSNIEIENNIITGNTTAGADGTDFAVVAGSATYHVRGNTMNPGVSGNSYIGINNSSAGTPTINVEEGNDISGHALADINWSTGIALKCQFVINSLTLALAGFTTGLNVSIYVEKKDNVVILNFTQVGGTSNATTMTMATLPAYLRPARTQNVNCAVTDNGVNSMGIAQIATTGVITFFKDINASVFTNTGTKAVGSNSFAGQIFSLPYSLS